MKAISTLLIGVLMSLVLFGVANANYTYTPISPLTTLPPYSTVNGTNGAFSSFATLLEIVYGGQVGLYVGGSGPSLESAIEPINMAAGQSYIFNPSVEGEFDPGNTYAVNVINVTGSPVATVTLSSGGSQETVNITGGNGGVTYAGYNVQLVEVGYINALQQGAYLNVYYGSTLVASPDLPPFYNNTPETVSAPGASPITITVDSITESWGAQVQLFLVTGTAPLPSLTTKLVNESRLLISAGQSVKFTNHTTGGTPPYTNTYFVNGVATAPLTNGSIVFPTAGTYTVTLGTKDSAGNIANDTTGVTVTVTPPLEVSLAANRTSILVGQKVAFTNTTSGGTGGNTYNLTTSCDPVGGGGGATPIILQFNTAGTCTVTLHVTDASGEVNESSSVITVVQPVPALTTKLVNESRLYISAGQSVLFTNATTGGTGNYVNTYFVNGAKATPLANGSIVFSTAGTYKVTLGTKDSAGDVANDTTGVPVTVTPPLKVSLSANQVSIIVGQTVLFSNTTTGGTGSNLYTYTVSPSSGFAETGNKVTFSSIGNYIVTLHVTDASGEVNMSSVAITVKPQPVSTCSSGKATIAVSQSSYSNSYKVTQNTTAAISGSADKLTFNVSSGCTLLLTISGSSDSADVTGGTTTLTLSGSSDKVNVLGYGSTLTISGSSDTLSGTYNMTQSTAVKVSGSNDDLAFGVASGKIATLTLSGSSDNIKITGGESALTISGSDDTITAASLGDTVLSKTISGSHDTVN